MAEISASRRSTPGRHVRCTDRPHELYFAPDRSSLDVPPTLEAREGENYQEAFRAAGITGKWEGMLRRSDIYISLDSLLFYWQRQR